MKNLQFKPTLVLCSICLAVALLLSLVNLVTSPIIEANLEAAANQALLEVLPNGKNFTELTIDDTYPSVITKGYRAEGGFVFTATVTGKYPGLVISVGIDMDGKIVSTKVIASGETKDYSDKVFPFVEGADGKYAGMDLSNLEDFLVSKATYTSEAYALAVKSALQAFVIANGGEVDLRTPEQILQDNCNAAFGSTNLLFTRWFATEVLQGVKAVYEAPEKAGYVYAVGDSFIAVNAAGELLTPDTDDETAATVAAAHASLTASNPTKVAEIPEVSTKNVTITAISKTESGNFIFELTTKAFSSHEYDEYGAGSNKPIAIRVSISADGKIIDCYTMSHSESEGYGDKCATDAYYDGWRGVTVDGVSGSGVITGATYTTDGYRAGIKIAFKAFEILTGGADNEA